VKIGEKGVVWGVFKGVAADPGRPCRGGCGRDPRREARVLLAHWRREGGRRWRRQAGPGAQSEREGRCAGVSGPRATWCVREWACTREFEPEDAGAEQAGVRRGARALSGPNGRALLG